MRERTSFPTITLTYSLPLCEVREIHHSSGVHISTGLNGHSCGRGDVDGWWVLRVCQLEPYRHWNVVHHSCIEREREGGEERGREGEGGEERVRERYRGVVYKSFLTSHVIVT